jgi:hypothetical protein
MPFLLAWCHKEMVRQVTCLNCLYEIVSDDAMFVADDIFDLTLYVKMEPKPMPHPTTANAQA